MIVWCVTPFIAIIFFAVMILWMASIEDRGGSMSGKRKSKRTRPVCPMWDIPKNYRKCKICKYHHEHKCEYLEWEGEF